MRDTIYLIASRSKIERMTKTLPSMNRGEIPIKVQVTVEPEAYREPVIAKEIYVDDWREGIDIADVDFKETVITPEEAEIIKKNRLAKMAEILQEQGYAVSKIEEK